MVEEGSPAPDFEMRSDEGATVRLSDLHGRRVVVYFYPKDDTPGCTRQACGFRDAYGLYEEKDAVGLGISPDDEASHARFKAKFGLPFTLLSDPDRVAAQAYGVWREKTLYGKKSIGTGSVPARGRTGPGPYRATRARRRRCTVWLAQANSTTPAPTTMSSA